MDRVLETLQRQAGVRADMAADEAVRRTLLLTASVLYAVAGVMWGVALIAMGERVAGAIPLGYGLLTAGNVWLFVAAGHERWFRSSQLALTLLLPFAVQLALGGVAASGAVFVWAFASPLGALLVGEPGSAGRWFGGFLTMLAVTAGLQPLVRDGNSLSEAARSVLLVANVGTVLAIVFLLLRYFETLKTRAYGLLRAEEQKSERLLLNVLPAPIARRLKDGEDSIATSYESATVLFADMVGFTQLSGRLSPEEMVELLNEVFTFFDGLVAACGVEKIRTIGDGYMVVGGVPNVRDDHAEAVASLALQMLTFREHVRHPLAGELAFRIGINSGPVVAGIVGTTKFHFDVWGDAVNIASRMESQGLAGAVQVGPGAYPLLTDAFALEPRGTIDVKGKGELSTWLLAGTHP